MSRRTGKEQQLRGGMVELVGEHRLDDTQFVGDVLQVRKGVGHPDPAIAMLRELPRRAEEFGNAGGKGEGLALDELVRGFLTVEANKFGLVVKQVEVRRRA